MKISILIFETVGITEDELVNLLQSIITEINKSGKRKQNSRRQRHWCKWACKWSFK